MNVTALGLQLLRKIGMASINQSLSLKFGRQAKAKLCNRLGPSWLLQLFVCFIAKSQAVHFLDCF
jgi:hypothetical protein